MLLVFLFFLFFKYCDTWVAPAIAAQIVPQWESPDIILPLYILYYDY